MSTLNSIVSGDYSLYKGDEIDSIRKYSAVDPSLASFRHLSLWFLPTFLVNVQYIYN